MDLAVTKREVFGRKVKNLRGKGLIPAELYGQGVENVHLSVSRKDFGKIYAKAGESTLVNIILGASDKRPVMIHDVTHDPVTDEVVSVDFYQVKLDKKMKLKVPLEYIGLSQAVKDGGVLVKSARELEIEALPSDIPHVINVDVSKITTIGQSLYVKDLIIGDKVKISVNPETVIATVTAKMTEEEEAKLAAESDVTAIKTEGEEKRAEKEKEAVATEAAAPAAKAPEKK